MKVPQRRYSQSPLYKCAALHHHPVMSQSPKAPIGNLSQQSMPTSGGIFVNGVIAVQQRVQGRGVDQNGGAHAEKASSRASSC